MPSFNRTVSALILVIVITSGNYAFGSIISATSSSAMFPPVVSNPASSSIAQLADSGFEGPYNPITKAGLSGSIAQNWSDSSWGTVTADYEEQTTNPHSGQACQQVTVTSVGANSGFAIGQWVKASAGYLYTPGIWLQGTPGALVTLQLLQGSLQETAPIVLTADWQFVSVPMHIQETAYAYFTISSANPVTLCMDDASLSATPSTVTSTVPSEPLQPTAFGMHIGGYLLSKGPLNLNFEGAFIPVVTQQSTITGYLASHWVDNSYWAGSPITAQYEPNSTYPHGGNSDQTVTISANTNGQVQTAQEAYLVYGNTYASSIWIKGTPGMLVRYSLRQWNAPYTTYAASGVIASGGWQQINVRGQVTGAGPSALLLSTPSLGTLEFDDATLLDSNGNVPSLGLPWPATSFGTWRLWDQAGTTWAALEPAKGVWDFTLLDIAVNDAATHGEQIVLTLGQTPQWASARPSEYSVYGMGATAEPANMQDWEDYLETVASRYKGKIQLYELWDEPNSSSFYSGSLDTLIQLAQTAQKTLKSVDPNIKLIGPSSILQLGYLKQFLNAGGGNFVDIIGYHMYDYLEAPEDNALAIADIETVIANAGLSTKPLWITEGATGTSATTDESTAAALLARKYLVELASGAVGFNWYSWGPSNPFNLGTTEADGVTPTLAGQGLSEIEGWLVGNTLQSVTVDASGNWAIQILTGGGATQYIVWNPGATSTWTPPGGFVPEQITNILGVQNAANGSTISSITQPVLITGNVLAVASPVFSIGPGSYSSPQTVAITSTTSGSAVYYTTDGTTPTTASAQYAGPISVSSSETIQAIALAAGYSNSAVGSA